MTRICSLLPSATEIVAELGLAGSLVGRSEECDWPPEVRSLPVVSAARIETAELTSVAIDEAVRVALRDGRSLYAVDEELIRELAPDIVVTQDLCEVCAVSSTELRAVSAIDADVVSLDARTLAGVARSVRELAERLGVSERGAAVAAGMEAKLAQVRESVRGASQRRAFVCEWLDPPFAAGHWVPELVDAAGGVDVLGESGLPSFRTSWEEIFARSPELVVLAPCGFDCDRAAREAPSIDWPCRVVAVDANAYFSRPAPRIADGARQLAWLLHPDRAPDPGLPWLEVA